MELTPLACSYREVDPVIGAPRSGTLDAREIGPRRDTDCGAG